MATLPSDGSEDLQLILAASKCLDLLLVLQTEEFQMYQPFPLYDVYLLADHQTFTATSGYLSPIQWMLSTDLMTGSRRLS